MQDLNHLRPTLPDQRVILLADDEVMVRNLVRIALQAAGFFILAASDGEEALELSRKFPGIIDALVSDVIMPKLDGLSLRRQVLHERPGIKVLLMSGQMDRPLEDVEFLPKPFKVQELAERVQQLLR